MRVAGSRILGASSDDDPARMIRVRTMLPGVGAELGALIAEEPSRFAEFMREAARLDQPYKRWEYVRGVNEARGAGANIVGILPPGLGYTGFEGYWAGSGRSEEAIVAEEARLGVDIVKAIAGMTGTAKSLGAGLDVLRNPETKALYETAIGRTHSLDHIQRLEPVFGELLARLRAIAEESADALAYLNFQTVVETAVRSATATIYIDPSQGRLLADLVAHGKNVESVGIEERYEVPQALVTNRHSNSIWFTEREHDGYHVLSEIGRLGHPVIRALLHIEGWRPGIHRKRVSPFGLTPDRAM